MREMIARLVGSRVRNFPMYGSARQRSVAGQPVLWSVPGPGCSRGRSRNRSAAPDFRRDAPASVQAQRCRHPGGPGHPIMCRPVFSLAADYPRSGTCPDIGPRPGRGQIAEYTPRYLGLSGGARLNAQLLDHQSRGSRNHVDCARCQILM